MDGNDKNISPVDPLLPMPVPSVQANSVQANSVHVCNAGNANGRLNRGLESCAGLESVPCLAPWNIPWNICSCANGHRLVFHADLVEHADLLGFVANNNCSRLFTALFP